MGRFVIEPAVALKWFFPEDQSSAAARLLDGGHEITAVETLPAEFGRLVLFKTRRGECRIEEGLEILEAFASIPFSLYPAGVILDPAYRIASTLDRPLGDGLSLCLAVALECRLVTVRRRWYDRLQDSPFGSHIKWVGDLH